MSNRSYRRLYKSLLVLLPLILCSVAVQAQSFSKELANGITLTQRIINSPKPQIINAVTIDPKAQGVKIRSVLSRDKVYDTDPSRGREYVSSMAKRLNATAVVNADFFPMDGQVPGDPLNLLIRDGELLSEPMSNRVAVGITSDGQVKFDRLQLESKVTVGDKWFPIRGLNRPRNGNELVVFTTKYYSSTCTSQNGTEAIIKCDSLPKLGTPIKGTVTEVKSACGDTTIPDGSIVLSGFGTGAKFIDDNLKPGTEITMEFTPKPLNTTGWEKVVEAVGGGPWLVKNGRVLVDSKDEGFNAGFTGGRNPRTAAGVTRDGKLVLATVDGRQDMSKGMSLAELAGVMLAQGCVEAINLDGGGSTTMATAAGILNSPSSGIERAVSDGLGVIGETKPVAGETDFSISAPSTSILTDTTVQLSLVDSTGKPLSDDLVKRAVWGTTTGGAGFVDQSGRFYAFRAKKGNVVATIGTHTAVLPIEVVGKIDTLIARLTVDISGDPNKSVLTASVKDTSGALAEGRQMTVTVVGGTAEQPTITTRGGQASTIINWTAAPGEPTQVTVTCGDLTPVVLQRPR